MLATEQGGETTANESAFEGHRELPLDLVHLTRQCQGDAELEDSLLRLFRRQARVLSAQLLSPHASSIEAKVELAHRLRGSALVVGARRVAQAAALVEESGRGAPAGALSPALARAIDELQSALEEAALEIDRLCQ